MGLVDTGRRKKPIRVRRFESEAATVAETDDKLEGFGTELSSTCNRMKLRVNVKET